MLLTLYRTYILPVVLYVVKTITGNTSYNNDAVPNIEKKSQNNLSFQNNTGFNEQKLLPTKHYCPLGN